jgi:Zn-dependent protease with chaperone function
MGYQQLQSADSVRYSGEKAALALSITIVVLIAFGVLSISPIFAFVLVVFGLIYIKLRQRSLLGKSVPITKHTYKTVHDLLYATCTQLAADVPQAHVVQNPNLNAYSTGAFASYSVVLNSGLIDSLDREELHFVIGHEVGHIVAGHSKWLSYIAPHCCPVKYFA